MMKFMKLMKD